MPAPAIDILKPAYDREPGQRRDRAAAGDGVRDDRRDSPRRCRCSTATSTRHPTDQGLLLAAIVSQYELVRGGQVLSMADRAKMRSYALAYKGPERALVEKYLQSHEGSDVAAVSSLTMFRTGATTPGPPTATRSSTGSTSAPTCGDRISACPRAAPRSRATSPTWRRLGFTRRPLVRLLRRPRRHRLRRPRPAGRPRSALLHRPRRRARDRRATRGIGLDLVLLDHRWMFERRPRRRLPIPSTGGALEARLPRRPSARAAHRSRPRARSSRT